MSKLHLAAFAIAILFTLVNAEDLDEGQRTIGDELICQGNFRIPFDYDPVTKTINCNVKKQGQLINKIVAKDLGWGGFGIVEKGGIGHNNVTIYFYNLYDGLYFDYEIFAKS